jgi:hypothetical protein
MTPEGAAWLREMWGYCRELSPGERARKLTEDRQQQKRIEEWAAETHNPSPDAQAA